MRGCLQPAAIAAAAGILGAIAAWQLRPVPAPGPARVTVDTLYMERERPHLERPSLGEKLTTAVAKANQTRLADAPSSAGLQPAQVEGELLAIPFGDILVLADPDAGCDFDLTTLRYADGDPADDIAFLRINLFVRLWRALGWTIEETDRALQVFVPKSAPFEKANLSKQPLRTALIYLAHLLLYYAVGAGIGYLTGGTLLSAVQLGLSLVVWGVLVRTVAVWHITWSVNSLSHLFGYQNYDTQEHSRNNWLVALLSGPASQARPAVWTAKV